MNFNYDSTEAVLARFAEVGVSDTFGTKKEVRELPSLLHPNEIIMYATSGFLDGNTWLIVCTDQRLLFVDKGLIYGIKVKEYKLDKINAVTYTKGLILGKLMISHGSYSFTVEQISKDTVDRMSDTIHAAIENYKRREAEPVQATSSKSDSVDEIIRYKELMDAGIISEEEFEAKKKILLGI